MVIWPPNHEARTTILAAYAKAHRLYPDAFEGEVRPTRTGWKWRRIPAVTDSRRGQCFSEWHEITPAWIEYRMIRAGWQKPLPRIH